MEKSVELPCKVDRVTYWPASNEYHVHINVRLLQESTEKSNSLTSLSSPGSCGQISGQEQANNKIKQESFDRETSPNNKLELPTYDGSSSWNLFKERFDAFIDLNGISLFDKEKWLLLALNGPALEVLNELSAYDRQDYCKIVEILTRKFGTADRETKLYRTMLKMRQQKREESLVAFAEDIQTLASLAYSNAPQELLEYLTIQAFIDGLVDAETKKALILADHVLLRSALIDAIKLESCSVRLSRAAAKSQELSYISAFTCDNPDKINYPTLEL